MQKNYKPHPNSFKNTFCVFHEVLPEAIEGLKNNLKARRGVVIIIQPKGCTGFLITGEDWLTANGA